jgi:hypothetical protein
MKYFLSIVVLLTSCSSISQSEIELLKRENDRETAIYQIFINYKEKQ